MKLFSRPIDLSGVRTVVYHLPDGPALALKIEGIEEYLDLELELGHVCDTSDIDGVLHFFPKGNA
ncbi:MAG: ATPase AAA [Desulfobulbaceae bacterium BRH_c16a]|nr:MAG: ATPase AAA [Desulfobulbaceae bacterium BRH_c16a]